MRTQYHIRAGFSSFKSLSSQVRLPAVAAVALGLSLAISPVGYSDEDHAHHHIEHGHADLGIAFEGGIWDLHVAAGGHDHDDEGHDEDEHGEEFGPDDAAFILNASTARIIPPDAAFSFLGSAGSIYYVAPQGEEDAELADTIFLGINMEEISSGIFDDDQISLRLHDVQGPGEFFGYQVDEFGDPIMLFSTADGWPDTMLLSVGSHSHLNWAFTAPGDYELVFEAFGTTGDGLTSSGLVTYHFEVIPEPSAGLLLMLTLLGCTVFRSRFTFPRSRQ